MNEEAKLILEEIFGELSNNYENNIDFLNIKKEKYKDHSRYKNILDKILIKEKDFLNKESKEAYDSMMNTYVESINYGINLAKDYFEKNDIVNTKKVLETLIKSFSNSYINDEFGNCVYLDNDFQKELYKEITNDYRPIFECLVNKGYVYYMYGRVLLEENKVKEAMLSFDLAKTYSPFLKETYFFKALLLKVNKKFNEAKEELLLVHKYLYKDIDLADFYYFVGNYCYKFINKEYEFIMYQKSYSINPNKELDEELKSMKPLDADLEFNEERFLSVCKKEGIPIWFDKKTDEIKNRLVNFNDEYNKYLEE